MTTQETDGGVHQWVFAFVAQSTGEIIEIDGPEHETSQTILLGVLNLRRKSKVAMVRRSCRLRANLESNGLSIIVANPFLTFVGIVRFQFVVEDFRPVLLLHTSAYFVVGEKARLARVQTSAT